MLKTNCKAVKERIREYIIESYRDYCNDNDYEYVENFEYIAHKIVFACFSQKYCAKSVYQYRQWMNVYYKNVQSMFIDRCQGLPSILNCNYYYNCSATDLLGDWLEQTKEERSKYTEAEAEELTTKLLWRELSNAINYDYNLIISEAANSHIDYLKSIGRFN